MGADENSRFYIKKPKYGIVQEVPEHVDYFVDYYEVDSICGNTVWDYQKLRLMDSGGRKVPEGAGQATDPLRALVKSETVGPTPKLLLWQSTCHRDLATATCRTPSSNSIT